MVGRRLALRALLLALLLIGSSAGLASAQASPADQPASFDAQKAFVYLPAGAQERGEPLQVVFALHGMGGEGRGFCQGFLSAAERNGWIIVAPTFRYRNWRDPKIVAEDDVALTRELVAMLDSIPERYGVPVRPRAILFGFSRGGQLAHRFALAYPERTRGVATMSAGTYTVPTFQVGQYDGWNAPSFPFGTADLELRTGREIDKGLVAAVPFWVAVGGDDGRADDVPRQWDGFLGRTRIERARSFASAMSTFGAPVELVVYPRVGHAMPPEMIQGATRFIERTTKHPMPR